MSVLDSRFSETVLTHCTFYRLNTSKVQGPLHLRVQTRSTENLAHRAECSRLPHPESVAGEGQEGMSLLVNNENFGEPGSG